MGTQFHKPLTNDFFEQFLSARLQRHQHLPPVFPAPRAFHEAVRFHPVNQFHGAVVAQRQSVRKRADADFLPRLQPAYRQQQKVLLRLKPRLARRLVAFLQEASYQVTKL
jgi:hypothetical protein